MKISQNWMQYYSDTPLMPAEGIDELIRKIGAQLGAVEEVDDLSGKYKGIVVAKIVSCEKHPNADKLQVCRIDDAGVTEGVTRDKDGLVEVVCGAPNARAGLTVAWLPPGTTVPNTYSKDPFVLEARELRGVVSNGMLASAHELALSEDHSGILEIDDDTDVGASFAEVFKLNDHVIDIENKMFTHRPDCFGQLGVAREIAGIQGKSFTSPGWYLNTQEDAFKLDGERLPLQIINELPELVPRFVAVAMSGVTVKPSPIWLQTYLSRVGIRPINNVVDLTNYFMMLTGQPLHAYDYDKVKAQDKDAKLATLKVRHPREGEEITLLGGKVVTPRKEAVMIATADTSIGIAGVMGGAETEVDDSTKSIIVECATFDMYSIRRTAMEHGLFTDAVTRFTKGQSPLQNRAITAKIVEDIRHLAGGKVASEVFDENNVASDVMERGSLYPPVVLTADFINKRLGSKLSAEEIAALLINVEFQVDVRDGQLSVLAPFWRTDIEIPEDIVEEVGRLYGYDHLPVELPKHSIKPADHNPLLSVKTQLRSMLRSAGANELLTYSFVHGNLLDRTGQDKTLAYQLSNALSPDLQYYRMSLTPSLIEKVHGNIKAGYGEFALFEIGKAHIKGEPDPHEPTVPKEVNALSLVVAADEKAAKHQHGAPYYLAKKYLTEILPADAEKLLIFEQLDRADLYKNPWLEQMVAPYDPKRSAVLRDKDGWVWGVVGEFTRSVRMAYKLPAYCAGFEIDPLLFLLVAPIDTRYVPLSKFPKVEQDISLKVSPEVAYGQLYLELLAALQGLANENLRAELEPLDIYQKDDAKHYTFRLTVADYRKTLKAAEVNQLLETLATRAADKFSAERL